MIALLLLCTVTISIAEKPEVNSDWRRCYVCSGKYPDRECELYPKYVSKGPGQINCTRSYCTTYIRYKPKNYLVTIEDDGQTSLLRSLAPDDYEVDSIARDCEDNTRGNFCALDTDDMGVTCYTTCIDGLCNDVTRRPTWKDFHRANKEGGSSSKHYNYDYGQSEFAEDEHKERDPYERNRQDESYHPEDVNRSNRPYHPDDRSRQDTAYDSRDRSGQRSPYHPDVRNRFDEHYSSEDKSRHAPFQPEERRRPDVSTRLSSSKEDGIRYGPISEEKGDDNESEKSMPLPKRIENLGINGDDKTMATVAVYPKHSTADMNRSSKDNPRKRPSNNVKGDSKNAREGHPHSNKNDLNRRRGGRKGRLGGEKASGLNTAGSVQPIMWITLAFNFSALVGFLSI